VGVSLGSTDKTRIDGVGLKAIFTAKKGKNAQFLWKADGIGVLGYGRNLTD
jgi:hypothetical protein